MQKFVDAFLFTFEWAFLLASYAAGAISAVFIILICIAILANIADNLR